MPFNMKELAKMRAIFGGGSADGGSNVKFAYGKFTPSATGQLVVTHNLGVVPDLILVRGGYGSTSAAGNLLLAYGVSQAFYEANNSFLLNGVISVQSTSGTYRHNSYVFGVDNTSTGKAIHSANAETFTLGSVTLVTTAEYEYIAIGGLT